MSRTKGYIAIVAACVIWGTMGVLGKFAFGYGIRPETLIALRLLISSLTLLFPLFALKREMLKIERRDAVWFLLLGIFGTACQRVAYFYALDLTTATIAIMLYYTYPVFVTLYASLRLKERVTPTVIAAILLSFSGVALVVRVYEVSWFSSNSWGIGAGLLSSLFFVLYFFVTKKLRAKYASPTLITYGDGIGALFLLPFIVFSFWGITRFPPQLWIIILAIAWFPSLLSYLLYSYALKYVESAKGSILSVIEPLSTVLFSFILLGENLAPLQMAGIILTLAGIALLFSRHKE